MEKSESFGSNETLRINKKILEAVFAAAGETVADFVYDPKEIELLGEDLFVRHSGRGTFFDLEEAGRPIRSEITYSSTPTGVDILFTFGDHPNTLDLRVEFYPKEYMDDAVRGVITTDIRKSELADSSHTRLPKGLGSRLYKRLPSFFQGFVDEMDEEYVHIISHDGTMDIDTWLQTFNGVIETYEKVEDRDSTRLHEWSRVYTPKV